jgi:hypothetical protein
MISTKIFIPICAAGMLAATGASAQIALTGSDETSVDRSFDPTPKDCADVRWSQAALNAFPSIGSACQAVEQRDGKTYVKFTGRVEKVGDMGNRIRVDFDDGSEITFTPAPQTVLYIDGKRTPFSEVRENMDLNFYVPEDRLQAELREDPSRVAFIVFPFDAPTVPANQRVAQAGPEASRTRGTDSSPERFAATDAAELPSTAGPLPLLAVGGLSLLVGAAGMTWRRRARANRR